MLGMKNYFVCMTLLFLLIFCSCDYREVDIVEFKQKYDTVSVYEWSPYDFKIPLGRRMSSWTTRDEVTYLGTDGQWGYLKVKFRTHNLKTIGSEVVRLKARISESDLQNLIQPRRFELYVGSGGDALIEHGDRMIKIKFNDFLLKEFISLPHISEVAICRVEADKIVLNGDISLSVPLSNLKDLFSEGISGICDYHLSLTDDYLVEASDKQ